MSPSGFAGVGAAMGFPRVSGDEPGQKLGFQINGRFSPRERG